MYVSNVDLRSICHTVGQMAICQTGSDSKRAVLFGKVALSHGLGMKLGGVFSETLMDNFGCVLNVISSEYRISTLITACCMLFGLFSNV